MLKSFHIVTNRINFYAPSVRGHHFRFKFSQAPISTNSAINQSLRRSQKRDRRSQAQSSRWGDREDRRWPHSNDVRNRAQSSSRGQKYDIKSTKRYRRTDGHSSGNYRAWGKNEDDHSSDLASRKQFTPQEQDKDFHGWSLPEDLRLGDQKFANVSRRSSPMGRQPQQVGGFLSTRATRGHERTFTRDIDQKEGQPSSDAPLTVPYTTPASEFLYGTSVVISALRSSYRKLYKLYIYDGDNREARDQDLRVRRLALERDVVVERVKGDWLRVMDKMSTGRPHNGFILEASPLPRLPVVGLRPVDRPQEPLHVILDHQSREDEEINGVDTRINYEVGYPRYPLVLLLDGILDPGNLGAILRTAFFLGVDVMAAAKRSSAPLSPVALKASAGAAESLPLLSVDQPASFVDRCKKNGWKVYAAAAPAPNKQSGRNNYVSASALQGPLQRHPCIVILGSEGEGLRWGVRQKADYEVGVEGRRLGKGGVDSLNVSVAAGLLCEAFLRKPDNVETSAPKVRITENLLF